MNKINITISTGKVGYIAGATLFKQLGLLLSAKQKSQVCISGSNHDYGVNPAMAPFVKVNDRLITRATAGDVIAAVKNIRRAKNHVDVAELEAA